MVMPLMACGSIGNILRLMFRDGMEDEALIATIMKETLQALCYFHENSQIHRDVKAGNVLMDQSGRIYLSDFGVTSKLKTGTTAKTFTGSPCWMAPEVIEADDNHGYDFKADIWSFGIMCIELIKGVPPLIDLPPMKIILTILHSDPPQLGKDEPFDKALKEVINSCLQKDPKNRPSAASLLKKKFLNKAKNTGYVFETLVQRLPSIEEIVNNMPRHLGVTLVRERILSEAESWDFNVSSGNVI
jgi:serine/threonine protein kinase